MKKIRPISLLIALFFAFLLFAYAPQVHATKPTTNTGESQNSSEDQKTDEEGDEKDDTKSDSDNKEKASTPTGDVLFEGGECNYVVFGMTNWDCGVVVTHDQETLKTGIWTIAANIAVDITILASYLALGFVIYGGYLYTFSIGKPNKVLEGKQTLAHAFIGLAITMSTNAIMSTIRFILLGRSGSLIDCVTESCISPDTLLLNSIHWIIAIAGIVSAIFVVYGGIAYSTSGGSPDKIKTAKSIILNALIGLTIVALAEIITAFVSTIIRDANSDTTKTTSYHNSRLINDDKEKDTIISIQKSLLNNNKRDNNA